MTTATAAAATIYVSGPGRCCWARLPSTCIPNSCDPFPAMGGQGGNQQEDKVINYNTTNQKSVIFYCSFPYDTKVTSAKNEMAIRTQH